MSVALALGQRAWSTARIVWAAPFAVRFRGVLQALLSTLLLVAMISWNPADPSLNAASTQGATNWLGASGATVRRPDHAVAGAGGLAARSCC